MDWRTELPAMVRAELPARVADAFGLLPLRSAIRLSAARPGDPVVGQLGGEADLPVGREWPLMPDGSPLIFVARLDCAALSGYDVDLDLPDSGSLLFFLPLLEEIGEVIGDGIPPVIYVPEGTATTGRQVPSHLRHPSEEYEYPLVALTARTILSVPRSQHPAIAEDPSVIAELSDLLWHQDYGHRYLDDIIQRYRGTAPDHQVGGYSDAFQHPLEISAAYHARRPTESDAYQDPAFLAEARRWVTLLQLDEDTSARMIWGDGAMAMWAIRHADLAARNFGTTFFTVDGH